MKVIKWLTHPVVVLPVVLAAVLYLLELSQSTEPTAEEWKQIHAESDRMAEIQRKAAEQVESGKAATDDKVSESVESDAVEKALPTPVNGQVTDSVDSSAAEDDSAAPEDEAVEDESDSGDVDTPVNAQVTDATTSEPGGVSSDQSGEAASSDTDDEEGGDDAPQPSAVGEMNPFAALAPMGRFPAPKQRPAPPAEVAPSPSSTAPPATDTAQAVTVPEKPWRTARRIAAEGDLDTAIEHYQSLIERYGDSADLYGELGNLQLMRHDFQAAANAYFKAAKQLHAQGLTWRAWQLHRVIVQLDREQGDELRDILNTKP